MVDNVKEMLSAGQIPSRPINANVQTEEIELPSQGRLYPSDNPLASGKITLKYPTAKEEDILTSRNLIQKGTVIDIFLQSLVADKSINLDDMLLGDKNAMVIASRIMAYGKVYPVDIKCPSCGVNSSEEIDLSMLESKVIDGYDKISENNFEIVLPASKATVRFKVLTQRDDKQVDSVIKMSKKAIHTQTSPEVTSRLTAAILSVNGNEDRMEIKKFVDSMLTLDSKALRDEIARVSPDVDMRFNFQCGECGHEERMILPLGINFFWPGRKQE